MSCSDMQKKVSELTPMAETDDDAYYELEDLKIKYRSTCARDASARRASGRNDVVTEDVVYEENYAEEDAVAEVAESVIEAVTEETKTV